MGARRWRLAGLCLLAGPALAAEEGKHDYELSVTLDPIASALVAPFLELGAEYQGGQKLGIGVVGGAGYRNDTFIWDGGLQLNGYVVGDFGMGALVGAEALITAFEFTDQFDTSIGGYIGGKYIFDFGLTGWLHIGPAWVSQDIDFANGQLGVLVNLGLGWSF